ncbi:MAG TPA: NUDIX hydrolase [Candidatus Saccharimonadales bacterium]|nr:NUDIX hydrolase [Candidatus Saccharimonadales bacterium]
MPHFTAQEQNKFYNSQPGKRIGAVAWLENSRGELLIAKPSYKKGWTLVSGMVDQDESPLAAVIRETHEEIGLLLGENRFTLAGYRYVMARDGRTEESQLYFRAQLTDEEAKAITLQDGELSEFRFVPLEELKNYADAPRMQAVIAAAQSGFPFYVQNEKRIV